MLDSIVFCLEWQRGMAESELTLTISTVYIHGHVIFTHCFFVLVNKIFFMINFLAPYRASFLPKFIGVQLENFIFSECLNIS